MHCNDVYPIVDLKSAEVVNMNDDDYEKAKAQNDISR